MRAQQGRHSGRYASRAGGRTCWPVFLLDIETPWVICREGGLFGPPSATSWVRPRLQLFCDSYDTEIITYGIDIICRAGGGSAPRPVEPADQGLPARPWHAARAAQPQRWRAP